MALDPHVRRFLDMMALGRSGTPDVAARRDGLRALAALAGPAPTGVATRDLVLPGPAGPVAARLYAPETGDKGGGDKGGGDKGVGGSGAGLLFLHGGGLTTGGLDTHDGICRTLAAAGGLSVVAVDYRLAPEHPFPAALEDARAALAWTAAHAPALGIDPARLAVGGDSAGAGLAALLCQEARGAGPRIAAQLLICPVLDLEGAGPSRTAFASGYFLDIATIGRDARACGLVGPGAARFAPLRTADLTGLPPAHIHTAACDPVRDDGTAYAERLRGAGVPAALTCHAGMIHFFYGLGRLVPRARPILAGMAADFAGLLTESRAAA
ncbi:alpha/beta hydrolase [Methylobacterium sp. NEAU 140]|uniref:alpha/beta hydrolase n=1 Tax=Methylobacterium sp. NEAU 140 TaxID=3064945 RepID=UPI002735C0B4|nr:alpha/beta hydrolase [Methylobacterium sp. NEAU 140]MDP4022649.1 alpha/beta hydrolase [Methylobacterium sp. NEAU 140]